MIKNIDVIFRNPYNYCNLRKIIYHQYLPMLIGIFDQMGAQSDRLRCEVCQNLFLRPMNTGFLRHAVATALTVYGIETFPIVFPLTGIRYVATALTVYGIETVSEMAERGYSIELQQLLPFTVLKLVLYLALDLCLLVATALTVYGIETTRSSCLLNSIKHVATALTVYGIETSNCCSAPRSSI